MSLDVSGVGGADAGFLVADFLAGQALPSDVLSGSLVVEQPLTSEIPPCAGNPEAESDQVSPETTFVDVLSQVAFLDEALDCHPLIPVGVIPEPKGSDEGPSDDQVSRQKADAEADERLSQILELAQSASPELLIGISAQLSVPGGFSAFQAPVSNEDVGLSDSTDMVVLSPGSSDAEGGLTSNSGGLRTESSVDSNHPAGKGSSKGGLIEVSVDRGTQGAAVIFAPISVDSTLRLRVGDEADGGGKLGSEANAAGNPQVMDAMGAGQNGFGFRGSSTAETAGKVLEVSSGNVGDARLTMGDEKVRVGVLGATAEKGTQGEVMTDLGQVAALDVASRESGFAVDAVRAQASGRRLNTSVILGGSVAANGATSDAGIKSLPVGVTISVDGNVAPALPELSGAASLLGDEVLTASGLALPSRIDVRGEGDTEDGSGPRSGDPEAELASDMASGNVADGSGSAIGGGSGKSGRAVKRGSVERAAGIVGDSRVFNSGGSGAQRRSDNIVGSTLGRLEVRASLHLKLDESRSDSQSLNELGSRTPFVQDDRFHHALQLVNRAGGGGGVDRTAESVENQMRAETVLTRLNEAVLKVRAERSSLVVDINLADGGGVSVELSYSRGSVDAVFRVSDQGLRQTMENMWKVLPPHEKVSSLDLGNVSFERKSSPHSGDEDFRNRQQDSQSGQGERFDEDLGSSREKPEDKKSFVGTPEATERVGRASDLRGNLRQDTKVTPTKGATL